MVVYLEKMMERLNFGLQNHFVHSRHWSDEKWKSIMARGGGNKKRFQYCTDSSGQEVLYIRALQGHSGRNLIDPSLQDNVLIPDDFFKYIYHDKEHKDPEKIDLEHDRTPSFFTIHSQPIVSRKLFGWKL